MVLLCAVSQIPRLPSVLAQQPLRPMGCNLVLGRELWHCQDGKGLHSLTDNTKKKQKKQGSQIGTRELQTYLENRLGLAGVGRSWRRSGAPIDVLARKCTRSDLEDKFGFLQNKFGLSNQDMRKMLIHVVPALHAEGDESVKNRATHLEKVLGTEAARAIILSCPSLLTLTIKKHLDPQLQQKMAYLKDEVFRKDEESLRSELARSPQLVSLPLERIERRVLKMKETGIHRPSDLVEGILEKPKHFVKWLSAHPDTKQCSYIEPEHNLKRLVKRIPMLLSGAKAERVALNNQTLDLGALKVLSEQTETLVSDIQSTVRLKTLATSPWSDACRTVEGLSFANDLTSDSRNIFGLKEPPTFIDSSSMARLAELAEKATVAGVVAFDTEFWKSETSVVQLAFVVREPERTATIQTFVIDCLDEENEFALARQLFLEQLFSDRETLLLGFATAGDLVRLQRKLKCQLCRDNVLDLQDLCEVPGEGLASLIEQLSDGKLDKPSLGKWGKRPLDPKRLGYAALDAGVLLVALAELAKQVGR